jgi:hypothetical protein
MGRARTRAGGLSLRLTTGLARSRASPTIDICR